MKILQSYRVICADCGINCDLHACFQECDCEEKNVFCRHDKEETILCQECINKSEDEESEEGE